MPAESTVRDPVKKIVMDTTNMEMTTSPTSLTRCPLKHVTHVQLACDPYSLCSGKLDQRGGSQTTMCRASVTHVTPYFRCKSIFSQATGKEHESHVPYSVVCDWRRDCADNSDEAFCQFPSCAGNSFDCGSGQCISLVQVCDQVVNCKTGNDERNCDIPFSFTFDATSPPAVVIFDRLGSFSLIPLPGNSTQCPDTHCMCPGNELCLPVYTRCNGIVDCPGHEDEADCDVYTCEGHYRCRGLDKTICMHVNHLCDGWPQCPQHDDELMCNVTEACPDHCVCYGTTFTDTVVFQADVFPNIRYLEGRWSGLTLDTITNHTMLIYLGAGECGWRNLTDIHLSNLSNLHVLDISDNLLQFVNFGHFSQLLNLKELDILGNPISSRGFGLDTRYRLESLLLFNASRVLNDFSQLHVLSIFMPGIEMLDFSHSGLTSLHGSELFGRLKFLDLRGCAVSAFSPDFMKGMVELQQVFADDFKLCCPVVLPDRFVGQCNALADEISSCDNLLKYGYYRAALAIFATSALLGNLCSFVYRVRSSAKQKTGYSVFVIHLCVSDFFMGVFLLIIGVVDHIYSGTYLWNESSWKGSRTCSISGFIYFLSCEVSSFLIFLITVDRFLVIRFPFSHVRFGTTSAHVACAVSWGLGMVLASIPLLPVTSHWAFYSQTGICIPLPVTRRDFPGRLYSFSVMVVFNLVIFLSIAVGQALVYWSVRVNTMSDNGAKGKDSVTTNDKGRSNEATIARRLLIIAMSDFLCWFPIGVCGLLAKLGVPIPGEVNTAMAVFVLPFNSALNPFLYTYTVVREKRNRQNKAKLQNVISAQMKKELTR